MRTTPSAVIVSLCFALLAAPLASAQLPLGGGGGGSSEDQQTNPDRQESPVENVTNLVESAGDLLVGLVRPEEQQTSLNNPQYDGLQSPRYAVLTFLEAMGHIEEGREAAWPRALKTLALPPDTSEDQAKALARTLAATLYRLGPIRPTQLPSHADVTSRDQTRFELFPRGISHQWVWNALDDPPDEQIILRAVAPDTWKFSEATLEHLPQLYASLRKLPPRFSDDGRGTLFLSTFTAPLERTSWRAWLLMGAWIVGALVVGWLLKRLILSVSHRLHGRGWSATATFIRSFATPAAIVCLAVGLALGTSSIYLDPTLSAFRWEVVKLLLVLAVLWAVYNLIDLVGEGLRKSIRAQRSKYREMAVTVVRRILHAFAIVIFVIFVLQNVFAWDIGALLAGLGIAGLAVSLAGQDSVKNLFGAVTIFVNRPFVVGDWITFQGHTGEVRDVTMQCTRLRELSGHLITIPNMQFINEPVENYMVRPYIRREMDIAITYDTPAEKVDEAIDIVHQVLRDDHIVEEGMFDLDEMPPRVAFSGFANHYLNIKAYYWYRIVGGAQDPRSNSRGWFTYLDHCSLVNRQLLARFNEAGIDFAFPTQTLYLANDPDRGLAVESRSRDGDSNTQHEED